MGLFSNHPVVSVVRLSGVIGQLGPLRPGLSLRGLGGIVERAFRQKRLKAVALIVNSPGGSPVQSSLIHARIRALAEERDVPVLVFCEEVAASGGYWLACAGDEIYANENSIVGSIGVVSAGFGFVDLLKKIGVERRVYTAGERKSALDPFRPENAEDIARLKAIQVDMHDSFKDLVRRRRGKRLRVAEEQLFSGEFWTGKRALQMGLIDGIGELRAVLRDRFGEKVELRVIGERRGWLRRRLGMAERAPASIGAEFAAGALAAVEERAWWNRFGL
ncbi:MAG: S49 family peptidase [Alphaproteobacteria bacterium]